MKERKLTTIEYVMKNYSKIMKRYHNKVHKFTTIEYLMKNNLTILNGLYFTLNDYDYIKNSEFKKININYDKSKETLDTQDIIQRIKELYYLYKNAGSGMELKESKILEIIKK